MSSIVNVAIHSSQSPENVRRDLIESLHTRRVNHKFHYDSIKQTNKWLALHQAHSPSRNDRDCAAIYNRAFASAAKVVTRKAVHLVGLGCGGGQKDMRLLKLLKSAGKTPSYTPSDVSVAMTLVAQQAALAVLPSEKIFPLVCDLATANDLSQVLATRQPPSQSYGAAGHAPRTTRLITFLGMIPNFEPDDILPKLAALVRRGDLLLFSANLAPGGDYEAGVKQVLPQYDNELTRDWLLTFLFDLGVERSDGELNFKAERGAGALRRIVARFRFRKTRGLIVNGRKISFLPGENLRLFFSYRYTPELVRAELVKHGLLVCDEWITKSGEEGVFLCRRK
jgi:L-histidine Nalpha-methyltransferase